MASDFLCDFYSLSLAAAAISQRYFDGRDLLFPGQARSLVRLAEVVEELVTGFNEAFASESVQETGLPSDELDQASAPTSISIADLQEAVAPAARQHAAFLMDMARAEVLDALGENRGAVAIVDRYV